MLQNLTSCTASRPATLPYCSGVRCRAGWSSRPRAVSSQRQSLVCKIGPFRALKHRNSRFSIARALPENPPSKGEVETNEVEATQEEKKEENSEEKEQIGFTFGGEVLEYEKSPVNVWKKKQKAASAHHIPMAMLGKSNTLPQVYEVVQTITQMEEQDPDIEVWDAILISGVLYKMAKLADAYKSYGEVASQPAYKRVINLVLQYPSAFGQQALSNIMWAVAKLGPECSERGQVAETLLPIIKTRLKADTYTPQHVSNTLWAWATIGFEPDQEVMAELETTAQLTAQQFKTNEISNTIWAWSTLRYYPSEATVKSCLQALVGQIDYIKPQEIANVLWAFGNFGRAAFGDEQWKKEIFLTLESRLVDTIENFKPQECSNSLWATAKIGFYFQPSTIQAIHAQILRQVRFMKAQEISNSLWAYGRLTADLGEGESGVGIDLLAEDGAQLRPIERAIKAKIGDFIAVNLVNTVWGFAWVGHKPEPKTMQVLESGIRDQAPTFPLFAFPPLLNAWRMLGYFPGALTNKALENALVEKVGELEAAESLDTICIAYGVLGLRDIGHLDLDASSITILQRILEEADYPGNEKMGQALAFLKSASQS